MSKTTESQEALAKLMDASNSAAYPIWLALQQAKESIALHADGSCTELALQASKVWYALDAMQIELEQKQ